MSYLISKYPRTLHLPWSKTVYSDDKVLLDTHNFEGREVVVTVKMDGENTNLYRDTIHARSLNSGSHPSRDWVKNLHGQIKHDIPTGYRICGENLYAKHSIHYKTLQTYFMVFSVFDHMQVCLSWEETVKFAHKLGLKTVPVLYRGKFDSKVIQSFNNMTTFGGDEIEGYVVRLASDFHYAEHKSSVGKYVRVNHVKTSDHWMHDSVVKNLLKQEDTQ